MSRRILKGFGLLVASSTLLVLGLVSPASAAFGLADVDGSATSSFTGGAFTQAGGHPFEFSTTIELNRHATGEPFPNAAIAPDADVKDAFGDTPPGFMANPKSLPQCTGEQLLDTDTLGVFRPNCPIDSQVGVIYLDDGGLSIPVSLFNMVPPAGAPARFGFNFFGVTIVLDGAARGDGGGGFHVAVDSHDISQALPLVGTKVVFWGTPADPVHDADRCSLSPFESLPAAAAGTPAEEPGLCAGEPGSAGAPHSSAAAPTPFLTMPTRCTAPEEGLRFDIAADSWQEPGIFDHASFFTHEAPPNEATQRGTENCEAVPSTPELQIQPTVQRAENPSGLNADLKVPTDGLLDQDGIAQSHLAKVEVTLPEGLTINPSQAEGLAVCSPARFAAETAFSAPGAGCPSQAKIGTVSTETPLLENPVGGTLYVAEPDDPRTAQAGAENPFDTLIAVYLVLKDPEVGVIVKFAGEIEPDPNTGQLTATFPDLPQVAFSHFTLSFREGQRSPLVTPARCGTFQTTARFTPYANPQAVRTTTTSFRVTSGPDGGPCPTAGAPPFNPRFGAGSVNNAAGSFSPFDMRITRNDGEQEMTKFSAVLPPGEVGSLVGVAKCPEAAIAEAKSKTGLEEREHPSCPANSQIGRSLVGAGVGLALTYVPGEVYLGGAFHGDPLSVIAITPAVAGPFDVGTVVVHEALTLNPRTAEVEVDGSASDPIPHLLKGIPAKVRDLRVHVDRPNFLLNPTSCDPSSAKATLFGANLDLFGSADDVPVSLSDRFQAASCASLGFKPKLKLNLQGGTRRGGHPGLTALYTPRRGDANIRGLVVRLPRSAFLDQAHIRTICTRVQFAAKACPPGARYGYVRAWTPLLEEPLEGPVYLRSSNHKLPDLVFDLHGLVDIEVDVRIDSAHGGIRASLEDAPDAPLSRVLVRMQGGKKGLIVNSRDLCGSTSRADVEFEGHNGKLAAGKPAMRAQCGGKSRHKRG